MKIPDKPVLKNRRTDPSPNELSSEPWSLYILECADGSYYTGVAKDLRKRFAAHSSGKGARYTRTRLPVRLVYQMACANRSEALIQEYKIKALSRQKKAEIIFLNRPRSNVP